MRLHKIGMTVAGVVLLAGACGSSSTTKSPQSSSTTGTLSFPTATNTVPTAASCSPVGARLQARLGIPAAVAVKAATPLGNGKSAWYVAGARGALWVTDADPFADSLGLVLPLNAAARSGSDVGADVGADSPIFDPISATAPEAVALTRCLPD